MTATLTGPTGLHEVATWSEGAGRRVEIDGKAAPQTSLGAVARLLWLTPAMDRLWTEAASERRRFLDRLTLSLVPDHGDAVLAYDRALRERNRLLRDRVRDAGWFAALEGQMAGAGAQVTRNRLAALAELDRLPAPPDFPRAALMLEGDALSDEASLRTAFAEGRGRDQAAGRTLAGPHRDDLGALYVAKGMPAHLCSTGEQKALLLSVVLANAQAVARVFGAAPLLLLDEVGAHFDEERRAALFGAVLSLGAQAWMTGTEAALFAPLGASVARLAISEEAGRSGVMRIE